MQVVPRGNGWWVRAAVMGREPREGTLTATVDLEGGSGGQPKPFSLIRGVHIKNRFHTGISNNISGTLVILHSIQQLVRSFYCSHLPEKETEGQRG